MAEAERGYAMNVLEKIFEEIDKKADYYETDEQGRENVRMVDIVNVEEIIRSHMGEKEKVTSAEIISQNIDGKTYYEIKYKKVGEDHYTVGYSSYKLDYVVNWLNEYFEFCGEAKVSASDGKDKNIIGDDGWISVEERLPEKTGYYLVQLSRKLPNEDYSDMSVVLFNGIEKEFLCYANLIIAWQPLPERYKPEEKSKETN